MSQPNSIIADSLRDVKQTLLKNTDIIGVLATAIEQAVAKRFVNDENDIAYAELMAHVWARAQLQVYLKDLSLSVQFNAMVAHYFAPLQQELSTRGIELYSIHEGSREFYVTIDLPLE